VEQQFTQAENEEAEVSFFLEAFHRHKAIYGIVFYDPEKNLQALLDMEMSPYTREKIIDDIKVEDCCEGPLYSSEYPDITCWKFIKKYHTRKIQIALALGFIEEPVRCYDFAMV